MLAIAIALSFPLLAAAAPSAASAPDPAETQRSRLQPAQQAIFDRVVNLVEKERTKRIGVLQDKVRAFSRNSRDRKYWADEISRYKAEIRELESKQTKAPAPEISEPGVDMGRIPKPLATVRVTQVLDEEGAIIVQSLRGSMDMWIEGMATGQVFDDATLDLSSELFEIKGTRSYTTVLGSKRTLPCLRRVDRDVQDAVLEAYAAGELDHVGEDVPANGFAGRRAVASRPSARTPQPARPRTPQSQPASAPARSGANKSPANHPKS